VLVAIETTWSCAGIRKLERKERAIVIDPRLLNNQYMALFVYVLHLTQVGGKGGGVHCSGGSVTV
jgi:hypothetical protein